METCYITVITDVRDQGTILVELDPTLCDSVNLYLPLAPDSIYEYALQERDEQNAYDRTLMGLDPERMKKA
jgi:hypothetical protein